MFSIDLLFTFVIIALVIALFVRCLVKERSNTKKTVSELDALGRFILQYSKVSSIETEAIAAEEKRWLTENIVCKLAGSSIFPAIESGRFLAKGPVASLLPDIIEGKYKSIPALLTSIGITGTFFGITLGLSQFDSAAFDSASLLVSAASLLEGMKTAFYTSLAGLSSSAIFMVALNNSSSEIQKAKTNLTNVLADSVIEVSAVSYLRNIASSSNNQEELLAIQRETAVVLQGLSQNFNDVSEHLKSANVDPEKLGLAVANAVKTEFSPVKIALADLLDSDRLGQQVSTAVSTAVTEHIAPPLENISREIGQLKEIKEQSQQELAELLINKMRDDLIAPVTLELKNTAEAVAASNTVTDKLNQNVGEVLTQLADSVSTIDKFQEDTMQKLHGFALSLTQILDTFKNDTQGAMADITDGVKTALEYSVEGMTEQREAFENSVYSAKQSFQDMSESLTAALDGRQQKEHELFDNVELRMNLMLTKSTEAFTDQTDSLAQAGKAASELMDSARTNLIVALDDRQQKEHELFDNVESRINLMLTKSTEAFTEQTDSLTQAGNAASELMDSARTNLTVALDDRQQKEHELFDNVESRMNLMLTKSTEAFTEQTDSLTQVGNTASELMNNARANLLEGLGDIDNKINSMSAAVQTELEAFRLQYQTNLNAFFEQQNNSLEETLGKQADKLTNVVGIFQETFENEYKTRSGLLESLTIQHQELQRSAATIEKMAKAVGLHEAAKMSELQDTAATIGKQVGHLKKEYAQANIAFKEVTEGMPKAMSEYFERANTSFENFFGDFDKSASAIHNRLVQAADFLIEAKVQEREFDRNEMAKV